MITKAAQKTALGKRGEAFAAQFYSARGAAVIAANVSYAVGELDLIVREEDGTIVFVEVKTRSTGAFGVAEAVTRTKLRRMRRAAAQWLQERSWLGHAPLEIRFDVLALTARGATFDVDYFAGVEHGAG